MTNIQSLQYAKVLNEALEKVHAYWYAGITPISCDTGAGTVDIINPNNNIIGLRDKVAESKLEMSLVPNPAKEAVVIKLSGLTDRKDVVITIYSQFGQPILSKNLGKVDIVNEWIDLSEIPQGVYFVDIRVEDEKLVEKLLILN